MTLEIASEQQQMSFPKTLGVVVCIWRLPLGCLNIIVAIDDLTMMAHGRFRFNISEGLRWKSWGQSPAMEIFFGDECPRDLGRWMRPCCCVDERHVAFHTVLELPKIIWSFGLLLTTKEDLLPSRRWETTRMFPISFRLILVHLSR